MIARPRCRHCDRILMLGESWVQAAPRVFYCEPHKPADASAPPTARAPAEAAAAMMG